MSGKIYLRQPDGTLRAMTEAPFTSEDLLQRLLEDYPDLLAGEQMDPEEPRRWLLVRREMGVPDEAGAANRWSVDHLFLDQEGIPTLVEVKRSSDTRIRREVVGQMLDYAANAVLHWPVQELRAQWEQVCQARGVLPEQALGDLLGASGDTADQMDAFWESVKTNLQAGRLRLVFLADVIPPELRRVVEFLNGQMDPAEVLAVEVRQFIGEGLQSLVPRVVGQTATAQVRKSGKTAPARQWDEPSFMAALGERQGEACVAVARKLLEWIRPRAKRVFWGKGSQNGSFGPVAGRDGGPEGFPFTVWTSGGLELGFQYLRRHPAFAEDAARMEFIARLRAIPGLDIPPDSYNRRPNFPLSILRTPEVLEGFKREMEWAFARLASTDAAASAPR